MSIEKEHIIKLRLTDFTRYGHLSPTAVLDIFQDLATEHSIDMGMGIDELMERGLIWVVVRQKLEFRPNIACKPHQQVRVRTWPHDPTRLNIQRDYALYNLEGDLLVKGTSEWLLLDMESKKFASVIENYPGELDFCEDRAFEGKLKKIKDFDAEEPTCTVTPQFSDVDFNQHINNARYLNFVMNAIPQAPDRPLRSLQIDYRKELMPGETVSLFTAADEAGTHVKGINGEGKISFNCLLDY